MLCNISKDADFISRWIILTIVNMAYGPQQESMQIQEIEGKQCPWVYMRTVYKNQGSMSDGQTISQPVKNDNIS